MPPDPTCEDWRIGGPGGVVMGRVWGYGPLEVILGASDGIMGGLGGSRGSWGGPEGSWGRSWEGLAGQGVVLRVRGV